jgi:hypothetical protein
VFVLLDESTIVSAIFSMARAIGDTAGEGFAVERVVANDDGVDGRLSGPGNGFVVIIPLQTPETNNH